MNAATSTPAPIHDIAPPVPFFPYPLWMVLFAVFAILGLIGLSVWKARLYFSKFSKKRKIYPPERALTALGLLRARISTISPYEFGVEASTILRRYVQEEHGLSATTQTSLEFLESIRNNEVFSAEEKTMLAAFLETADLLKFAKAKVGVQESTALLQRAEELVRTREKNIPQKNNPLPPPLPPSLSHPPANTV